jgi:DNA-binding response OmpR family regulator
VILVADDDPVIVRLLEINFRFGGYQTVGAARGEEAVRLARELRPAAVILDLTMPGLDGHGVLEELRASPETRGIPVFVVSAHQQDAATEPGYASGVADYMTKPFDPGELVERVQRWLASPGS